MIDEEKDNNSKEEESALTEIKQQDNDIISDIVKETDVDKLKDLTNLFNAFQIKRHVLRVNALNDVQDALAKQMLDRLSKYPDNFSNSDIATWMKTVQQAMESSQGSIEKVDTMPPIVHQNNTQVNINVEDTLSRESREKILGILNKILPQDLQNDSEDNVFIGEDDTASDVIDIDESEDTSDDK